MSDNNHDSKIFDEVRHIIQDVESFTSVGQKLVRKMETRSSLLVEESKFLGKLMLVSGVIAPLSLTLLSIEWLTVEQHFLLAGFLILLINIIYLLFVELELQIVKSKVILLRDNTEIFVAQSKEIIESGLRLWGNSNSTEIAEEWFWVCSKKTPDMATDAGHLVSSSTTMEFDKQYPRLILRKAFSMKLLVLGITLIAFSVLLGILYKMVLNR